MSFKDPEKKRAYYAKWRAENKDKNREYQKRYRDKSGSAPQKAWKARNPTWYREHRLSKDYGITYADYQMMLASQSGVCAICGLRERYRLPDGSLAPLVVDHDHATDGVRGLLCRACNSALGLMEDDPERLRRAIKYLAVSR